MGPGAVHLWRVSLALPAPLRAAVEAALSEPEWARAARLRPGAARDRFTLARGALRDVLARYVGVAPARLAFEATALGKPALPTDVAGGVRFNLSHSGAVALIAVARDREVGVDVEERRPVANAERIAATFFSAAERAAFGAAPAELRERVFLECWTRKEAVVKALGGGLSIPLSSFDVGAGSVRVGDRALALRGVDVGPGYTAAVAAEGEGIGLETWDWAPG